MKLDSVETANERPSLESGWATGRGEYGRPAKIFIAALCAYAVLRGLRGAISRPFWFDELFTVAIAGQKTLGDMWMAMRRGFDSAPPLFYLIERFALAVPIKKEVALRLPSILAFPCTLVSLYTYAKRRHGEMIACVCAFLVLSTILFHTYPIEARSYSMMIACIVSAMVCYQRLPSRRWTVAFGLSLVVAESLHYYAVLAMVPFWFAEVFLVLRTRSIRWPVWAALVCGVLPLIVFWRFIMAFKMFYGPNIFARPSFEAVHGYYASFFLLNENAIGRALLVVAVVSLIWWASSAFKEGDQIAVEAILLLSMAALGYIVYPLVKALHGLLLIRYVMVASVGIILGFACTLSLAGRRAALIFALFALCVMGMRESRFWRTPTNDPFMQWFSATSKQKIRDVEQIVRAGGHDDLPVVISDCLLYSQLAYYLPPNFTTRLVYLTDEKRELRYTKADTSSRSILGARDFLPFHLADYSEFLADRGEFLLYSEGLDWYSPALKDEGASMDPLGRGLYLVRLRSSP